MNGSKSILAAVAAVAAVAAAGLFACAAHRKAVEKDRAEDALILPGTYPAAAGFAMWDTWKYLVLERGADGTSSVTYVDRHQTRVLWPSIERVGGMSVDYRRAELHLTSGPAVEIRKLKKPQAPPVRIEVVKEGALGDLTVSLMNRRTYAVDPAGNAVYEIHPDKRTARVVFSKAEFDRIGKGGPERVRSSVDGARLFLSTPHSILAAELRTRKITVLHEFPAGIRAAGLELYRNRLVTIESETGRIVAYALDSPRSWPVANPDGIALHPVGFSMDNQFALVLDRGAPGGSGRLHRYRVTVPF